MEVQLPCGMMSLDFHPSADPAFPGTVASVLQSAEHSDLTIYVEVSADLDGPWTELARSVHGAPFTGPGTVSEATLVPGTTLRRVTVRDVENIETNARRFTRVRVVAD